jgi:hypothetical protein
VVWIAVALALLLLGLASRRAALPAGGLGWLLLLLVGVSVVLASRLGGRVLLGAGPVLAGLAWRWLQVSSSQPTNGDDTAARGLGNMTRPEALRVLGLTESADAAAIARAHRALIKKVHPDQGGSDFLAQQVNQAKRVLDAAGS